MLLKVWLIGHGRSRRREATNVSDAKSKVQKALSLCREAVDTAMKAAKAKQRLTGNHFYAKRFQEIEVELAGLREDLTIVFATTPIPTADGTSFFSLLAQGSSAEASERDRTRALRDLRLLAEARIIKALERADHPDTPATQEVLPLDLVANTRGYISSVALQANGCYERGWYDAASLMIRKLIEILIVELYERSGRVNLIRRSSGDFMMLGDLIDVLVADSAWNLARETKSSLPKIKWLGDQSAHNRRFVAKKPDVEKVIPGLRVAVEDLLHLSQLK
jgi:hypothetical protein